MYTSNDLFIIHINPINLYLSTSPEYHDTTLLSIAMDSSVQCRGACATHGMGQGLGGILVHCSILLKSNMRFDPDRKI